MELANGGRSLINILYNVPARAYISNVARKSTELHPSDCSNGAYPGVPFSMPSLSIAIPSSPYCFESPKSINTASPYH